MQAARTSFECRLRVARADDSDAVHTVLLPLDDAWQRAREAMRWRAFASGVAFDPAGVMVEPRLRPASGPATLEALVFRYGGTELPMPAASLFASRVRNELARLRTAGVLDDGEKPCCRIDITPLDPPVAAPEFQLDDYPPTTACRDTTGIAHDAGFGTAEDTPIRLARHVIEAAIELASNAGESETGGVLFGGLRRLPDGSPLIEVTHLCPAREGRGEHTSFTFTPETWSLAQDELDRRGAGEIMLGTFHNHPDFCLRCDPSKRAGCPWNRPFYSADDIALHETVFPAAYGIGLLVAHQDSVPVPSVWGWRGGFIARRSFTIHPPIP